jgi:hypothetical protein
MNKSQLFRNKKSLLLFVAMGLVISFSNCSNETTDRETLVNSAWISKTDNTVIELYFNDDNTCSISNGANNAFSVNLRKYDYERGLGVDLFILEKSGDEKGKTIFSGQFNRQDKLTLFFVEDNVAAQEYATFKRIK